MFFSICRDVIVILFELVSLLVHSIKLLVLLLNLTVRYLTSSDVLINHLIIEDFLILVVFIVFPGFQKNVFDLFTTFCLTTAQVIESALNKKFI